MWIRVGEGEGQPILIIIKFYGIIINFDNNIFFLNPFLGEYSKQTKNGQQSWRKMLYLEV